MRLGMDIGGTKTAAVLIDDGGAIIASATAPSGRGAKDVVTGTFHLARRVVDGFGGPGALTSAGACIPGLVDPRTGIVRHAVNLDVEVLDLGRELGVALGMPVSVENDVKAAALGAYHLSQLGTDRTLAYLNLGTGLAAAVVHAGEVVRGVDGAAGEVGHVPVGGDVICACGQTGCLETFASGSALERLWPEAAVNGWDVLGSAARGDEVAELAAQTLVWGVALAVQLLVIASGAESIVMGGGLTSMGEPLLDRIRVELTAKADASPFLASLNLPERLTFLPAGVPVAAIGAARLGLGAPGPAELAADGGSWRS